MKVPAISYDKALENTISLLKRTTLKQLLVFYNLLYMVVKSKKSTIVRIIGLRLYYYKVTDKETRVWGK